MSSDTSANNQIVAFQPNGAAEESNGARAMIMQFFNSTDTSSAPGLDSGPLEALFRDLGSAPSGPDVSNLHNRQSGVTLTEMNMLGVEDDTPGPLLNDVSHDQVDLPMPPHLAARIPRLEGM